MFENIRKSLKAKMFILFFAMNLAGILVVGFISYQSKRTALGEQVENNLSIISVELADKVDRYLSERMNDTKAIALHYSLYGLKSTTSSQNKILARYLKIYPYYYHISIINLEDLRMPDSEAVTAGYKKGWFLPVLGGNTVSSDMFVSPLSDRPTMAFAAPVMDDKGRVVSILTTDLKLEYLWDIVDQVRKTNQKSGLSGYAFILNKDGLLLAHPEREKILAENAHHIPDKGARAAVSAMLQGNTGTANVVYEGVAKSLAYAPCKGYGNYKGNGWSLAVTYPHSELYAPMKPLLEKYILLFFVSSLIIFFISTKLADYIVRPVLKLKEGAARIGAGNFNLRIEPKTADEIGDLAKSFNHMAETLEARDNQINEYTHKLTRINRELESKQEELSRANEVLKRTNEDLRKLEKQKADFMAMISHDIKSPLSTVITYSEMVLNGTVAGGGEDLARAMNSIHASAYKILSLVDNFLVSSAVEAGRLQLRLRPLDINDFVDDELPFFTPQAEKKKIRIQVVKAPGLPPVMADKVQLDRAFSNIVSNAVKYTDAGGGITITTALPEGFVAVSVKDTGRGIPEGELKDVFKKYKRTKDSLKEEGLGLGLFISKAVVEAHGGEITVESKPGAGTTFTILLPLQPVPGGGSAR